MASPKKVVLMTQALKHQGEIWHDILTSQGITVIWESIDSDLSAVITQMHSAGLTLPDLLLVDMGMRQLNPYTFCHDCREDFPSLKIILTVGEEKEVSTAERQWAIYQGAMDLLPGIQQSSLLPGVISCLTRILEVLEMLPIQQDALMSSLSALSTRNAAQQDVSPPTTAVTPSSPSFQSPPTLPTPDGQTRRRYRGASY